MVISKISGYPIQHSSNAILLNIEDRINRDRSDLSDQAKKELLEKIRSMQEQSISTKEIDQIIKLFQKNY